MNMDLQTRIAASMGITQGVIDAAQAAGYYAGQVALAHAAWRQAKARASVAMPGSAAYRKARMERQARAIAWANRMTAFESALDGAIRTAMVAMPDFFGSQDSLTGGMGHSLGASTSAAIRSAWAGRGGHMAWIEAHGLGRLTWPQAMATEGLSRAFMDRVYSLGGLGYTLPRGWQAIAALACLSRYALSFQQDQTPCVYGCRRYGRVGLIRKDARA